MRTLILVPLLSFVLAYTPSSWEEYVLDEVCDGNFRCMRCELYKYPTSPEISDSEPVGTCYIGSAGIASYPSHSTAPVDIFGDPVYGYPVHWNGSSGPDAGVALCCTGSPGPCWVQITVTCGAGAVQVNCEDGVSNPDGTVTCFEGL